MNNEAALDKGLEKARKIAFEHIQKCLEDACDELVRHAQQNYKSPIGSFTGNTITSYSVGLYINGSFVYYYQDDGIKPPVRGKLTKKEGKVELSPDWEGRTRSYYAKVDTDGGYGKDSALDFLNSYKSRTKGVEIVMCSGTEYSSYIQDVMKGNVLEKTKAEAPSILMSNMKPMK